MLKKYSNTILPPAKIGIIGGGQLGKMLAVEAKRMGYKVIVLDEKEDSPAAQVADEQIVGSKLDPVQIRKLAELTNVITYEFEFINAEVLCELEDEGYKIHPSGRTLKKIQNKYNQKLLFHNSGLPVPRFRKVTCLMDIKDSIKEFGLPIVLKGCTGGYDGKGNYVIKDEEDIYKIQSTINLQESEFMVEEFIKFEKELSIVIAKGQQGDVKYFPVAENKHENSILKITKVPANIEVGIEGEIINIADSVFKLIDDIGVFCIELFITGDGKLYINEIAPRPHNSGHYSIEGCTTSQFEQQLRAITGLPLGSTKLLSPTVMVNILGESDIYGKYTIEGLDELVKIDDVNFHFYGKDIVRFEKKIGHITVLDKSLAIAEKKAQIALNAISIKGDN